MQSKITRYFPAFRKKFPKKLGTYVALKEDMNLKHTTCSYFLKCFSYYRSKFNLFYDWEFEFSFIKTVNTNLNVYKSIIITSN